MRRIGTFCLLALIFATAGAARAEISIYFSPNGGCDQAVVEVAVTARTYLHAACYTFTLDSIAQALIKAKERGLDVRVIVDRSEGKQKAAQTNALLAAGIPVMENTHSGLMHDKFLVADGQSVVTGSFNWTQAAVEKNDENLIAFKAEPAVAGIYAAQFDRMWNDAARFTALSVTARAPASPALSPAVTPSPPPPAVIERVQETVYITAAGKKFHRAGCRYLAHGAIAISRTEAIAKGYTPCSVCRP